MSKAAPESISSASVHLVGSVKLDSPERVFRECGNRLRGSVFALPDGETDYRSQWIHHLAYKVYYPNTDLLVLNRPAPVEARPSWYAASLDDQWVFEVRPDRETVALGELGYAAIAQDAYRLLRRLREEGVVDQNVRLQVALPYPHSAVGAFVRDDRSQAIMIGAYRQAVIEEIGRLLAVVPARELSIQWDVCWEVLYLAGGLPWVPPQDAWDNYISHLQPLAEAIPEATSLGYHYCYGSWEGRHMVEPIDLELSVQMANAAVEHAGRAVDFVHMTVPISRSDDEYFAPLQRLDRDKIGQLFLGLVHLADGVSGAQRRGEAARRHVSDFGVAAECGVGRGTNEDVLALLDLHQAAAASLRSAG